MPVLNLDNHYKSVFLAKREEETLPIEIENILTRTSMYFFSISQDAEKSTRLKLQCPSEFSALSYSEVQHLASNCSRLVSFTDNIVCLMSLRSHFPSASA